MGHRRRALAKYVLPLGAIGLAAAPALATGAPATFAPAVNYPLGQPAAYNFGVGDFNADGNVDVASGSQTATPSFVLLPGNGDGTFGTVTTVATPATTPTTTPASLATGDLNNDGKPDLVFRTTNGTDDEVVALNQTTGGAFNFTSPTGLLSLPSTNAPGTPALGDLNEDGKLDIVQPAFNSNIGDADTVKFRLGNGNGTFRTAHPLFTNPTPGAAAPAAALADVNGDGHLDALATVQVRGFQDGSVLTALGNGDGTFQMPATRSDIGVMGQPQSIAVADLNGDGHPDVVTAEGSRSSILLGNGNGTFRTAVVDPDLPGYAIAVADLNGDGIKDLAVADPWYYNSVDIALGNGDGTFATATRIAMPSHAWPYGIALNDVSGDGLADVLVTTYGTHNLSVLINTSVAMAPAVTSVSPSTGPAAGGTSVTITGTAFTGATAVTFGGVNATSFTVNSPTSITAVAPAHAGGVVSVAVTTPNGRSTAASAFTYAGAPAPDPSPLPTGGTTSPGAGEAALPATRTPDSIAPGRLSMSMPRTVSGRTLVSSGAVPPGADRITQTATSGASGTARTVFGAWSTARAQTSCPITTRGGRSTFTCTLRLAPGRWTVTTTALSGSTTVSRLVATVRMKAVSRLSVTG